jgi:transcriptional regulator with XRE-family HTH domain
MTRKPAAALVFAKRLSSIRRLRGLTQARLGREAHLKQTAISLFETARRAPSLHNLVRLADALDVSSDYLIGRSNKTQKSKK